MSCVPRYQQRLKVIVGLMLLSFLKQPKDQGMLAIKGRCHLHKGSPFIFVIGFDASILASSRVVCALCRPQGLLQLMCWNVTSQCGLKRPDSCCRTCDGSTYLNIGLYSEDQRVVAG